MNKTEDHSISNLHTQDLSIVMLTCCHSHDLMIAQKAHACACVLPTHIERDPWRLVLARAFRVSVQK